jgi:hypothetical protein
VLQLVALRNDFDGPAVKRGLEAGFEAEMEVARVLRVDTEGIYRTGRIGLSIGFQPTF